MLAARLLRCGCLRPVGGGGSRPSRVPFVLELLKKTPRGPRDGRARQGELEARLEARPRGASSYVQARQEDDFACRRLGETVPQFTHRISKVAERMNSPAFSGGDGRGLPGLATELHERCRWVIDNKGQRYPK